MTDLINSFNDTYRKLVFTLKKNNKDITFGKASENSCTKTLQEFMKQVVNEENKFYNMILTEDTSIFSSNFEISSISFENLEVKSNIHSHIFVCLNSLLLIGLTLKNKARNLEDLKQNLDEKQKNDLVKIIENMKKKPEEEAKTEKVETTGNEFFDEILNDSLIGNLAAEMTQNLNIDQEKLEKDLGDIDLGDINLENMENLDINSIFSKLGDNKALPDMVSNVQTSLNEKLESGEVSKELLMADAQKMMQKLQKNPQVRQMMQSGSMQQMMKNMMSAQMKDSGNDLSNDDLDDLCGMFQPQPKKKPTRKNRKKILKKPPGVKQ